MKNIRAFLSENFQFLKAIFSIYLNSFRNDYYFRRRHDLLSRIKTEINPIKEGLI